MIIHLEVDTTEKEADDLAAAILNYLGAEYDITVADWWIEE